MTGQGLLRILIESTGLPTDSIEQELTRLMKEQNVNPDTITIDDVREILSVYLQDTLVDAKDKSS